MELVAIAGYEDYCINRQGEVFKGTYKMSSVSNGLGYKQIKLRNNGVRKNFYVHRLVWQAFKGEIPKGLEINHIDHNKANNNLNNLELITHSENLKKSVEKYGYYGLMNRPKQANIELS